MNVTCRIADQTLKICTVLLKSFYSHSGQTIRVVNVELFF